MTTAIITITPVTNIKNNVVVSMNKVETEFYDANMDMLTFYNVKTGKTRKGNLMTVSLYDDRIVREDSRYHILHMLTKG